jgi:hypothetical protein
MELALLWMERHDRCWSSPFLQPIFLILQPFTYPLSPERPHCQEVGMEHKPPLLESTEFPRHVIPKGRPENTKELVSLGCFLKKNLRDNFDEKSIGDLSCS